MYSVTDGTTRKASTAIKKPTNSVRIRPVTLTPACFFFDHTFIDSLPAILSKTAYALEITQIHPDKKRLADDVLIRDESPVPAVQTIVSIIAHHEIMSSRNCAGKTFRVVAAKFLVRKRVRIGHVGRRALIVQYPV